MKNKSLPAPALPVLLDDCLHVVASNLGQNSHLLHSRLGDGLDNVAHGNLFNGREGFKRLKNGRGQRDMHSGFTLGFSHVAIVGEPVATIPEETAQNRIEAGKPVDTWPHIGHKSAMEKTTRKKAKSPKVDAWEGNRQRFYMLGPQFAAFAKACELKGKSVSEVLQSRAKAFVREHAHVLREAGVSIPAEIFTK